MSRSTDWVPSLWIDTFDELLCDDNELDYGDQWTLSFYSQTDRVTKEERKRDWKVYCHCAYGNFQCTSCRKTWPSARVVVVFRYRLCGGQGTVIMRPFGQACRRCEDDEFHSPGFSKNEVRKVLLRLIRKIQKNCYGDDDDDDDGSSACSTKVWTKPHEASLCQACIMGICCQGQEPDADHDGVLFYNTYVAIDPNKCRELEHITLEQSASQLWHDSRKVRITASKAKKVPIRAKPQTFIRDHLYPRFYGNDATRHGSESEASALKWLKDRGFAVRRSGTVVCASEPWLSASPDGILNSKELLEIKCPFLKNESLDDLFRSQRYDVKMVEGRPQLQPNGLRGFYMQVQLGMFCTGLRACRLLIWAPPEYKLLKVSYDEQFCANTVDRLRAFYFKYMLPYVSDEFQAGRLLLSARYLQFCTE